MIPLNSTLLVILVLVIIALITLRIVLKVAKTLLSIGIIIVAGVILFYLISNYLAPAL